VLQVNCGPSVIFGWESADLSELPNSVVSSRIDEISRCPELELQALVARNGAGVGGRPIALLVEMILPTADQLHGSLGEPHKVQVDSFG